MLNPKIISYSDEESLKSIIERNRFDLKLFGTSKRRLADFLESFLNMESNEKFTITKENWCDPHKCPFGCDENSGIDINVYSKEFQETIKFNSLHIHTIREHCFEGEDGSYQLNLNWVMIMLNLPSKHKIKWQFTSNFTPVYYFSEGFLTKLKINKKNPFYEEFKTIIQKTIGIEALLKNALMSVEEINFAFIFGSYAKKDFRPESDIDMAVVGDVKEELLMKILKNIEKTIGREINYHLYAGKEFKEKIKANSFVRNIIKDYIMVTGDEREFRKLLKAS